MLVHCLAVAKALSINQTVHIYSENIASYIVTESEMVMLASILICIDTNKYCLSCDFRSVCV